IRDRNVTGVQTCALPICIECFDISNLQGSDVVASMVVWEDGRMKKSDYRRYIIRSLTGLPDDFQSMREVVSRRYKRLHEEGVARSEERRVGKEGRSSSAR